MVTQHCCAVAFAKAIGFDISLHICHVSIFRETFLQSGVNCYQGAMSFAGGQSFRQQLCVAHKFVV